MSPFMPGQVRNYLLYRYFQQTPGDRLRLEARVIEAARRSQRPVTAMFSDGCWYTRVESFRDGNKIRLRWRWL